MYILFSYRLGHIDVVKVLVEAKCDMNIKNNEGEAPLHFACKYILCRLYIVQPD